jgi:hypothetical protein
MSVRNESRPVLNESRLGVKRHIPNTSIPEEINPPAVQNALYSRTNHFASNPAITRSNDKQPLAEGFTPDQLKMIRTYAWAIPATLFVIGGGILAVSYFAP